MQTRAAQYLNDIVSLTTMSLLILALVAGEAERPSATASPATRVAQQDIGFRHDGE